MKKLLILFSILACSFAAYSQGPNSFGGVALRVNDTTTYQANAAAFHAAGYYDIYFNNQATNDHWDIWNGSSYDHVFTFSGGGSLSDWGDIGGTLSDQTDLQAELDSKADIRTTPRTITDDITLALTDLHRTIVVNAATQKTITIPLEATVAFQQGDWFYVEWADGAVGQPVLAPVSGSVTINSSSTGYTVPVENAKIYVEYRGSNQWIVENGGPPRSYSTWTPTLTGFSGSPTNLARYSIDGKHLTGYINISGTSNATTFTFTLPTGVLSGTITVQRVIGLITNNGTVSATGMLDVPVNSNVVNIYRDPVGTAFTTSGTKAAVFSFVIEIQ